MGARPLKRMVERVCLSTFKQNSSVQFYLTLNARYDFFVGHLVLRAVFSRALAFPFSREIPNKICFVLTLDVQITRF